MLTLPVPDYAAGSLADVLPSVAASLGVPIPPPRRALFELPPAGSAVVVLIDGLGFDQLQQRGGHAPWLRSQSDRTRRIVCGHPATTATSMGSFGTGLLPGTHGLLGYEILIPEADRLVNELSWENGPVPETWQPHNTVLELSARDGVRVTSIGPPHFDGSGLTRAALRGARFRAASSLADGVDGALAAVQGAPRSLVYLYWGNVDTTGHVFGPESWEWGAELESVDRELARLAGGLPAGCSLTITADHGMMLVPHEDRLDLAHVPTLSHGIRHVGGEPRARQLYCQPGAAEDVYAAWLETLATRGLVLRREDALAAGLFGPVSPPNLARIGDVIALMGPHFSVVDSRRESPTLLALKGLHGSVMPEEVGIPLVHVAEAGSHSGGRSARRG